MELEDYYYIKMSEDALIQLVLNGLEAFTILHPGKIKSKTRLETYGLLWGHQISLPNNNGILYSIETVSIDTSAERKRSSCMPNDSALSLKRDIMTSFWPQYDFLGDFHTHPYLDHNKVKENKYYDFSKVDYESLENYSDYWMMHNYRVGLVLTIAMLKKKSSKLPCYLQNNTIEFTLGNYRLWIKGYLATYNCEEEKEKTLKVTDHDEENVILICPSLLGLETEFSPFGKGKRGRGDRHLPGDICSN